MLINICVFQRENNSDWEVGLEINNQLILDVEGEIPVEVWDIKTLSATFSLDLSPIIEHIRTHLWEEEVNQ